MGAPTVMLEKLPRGDEATCALRALEQLLGRPVTHTVSIEAGGLNSVIPFIAAAELGLPLIDADGMGRAFPELQMVLPTLGGVTATPMAMADERGNSAVLNTDRERVGGAAGARGDGRDGRVGRGRRSTRSTAGRSRTTWSAGRSRCARSSGAAIRVGARARTRTRSRPPSTRLDGRVLFTGKVTDVARRTVAGFARGEATLAGLGAEQASGSRSRSRTST